MTWTAPDIEHRYPTMSQGERASLQSWLDFHRLTLRWKCSGLTHEQLAQRTLEPSTLSLLGIVRHMADVERWWFRMNVVGEDIDGFFGPQDNLTGDFDDLDATPAQDVLQIFERECLDADAAVRDLPLEHRFVTRTRPRDLDLRWVYLHMIEEYARHNGHADLLREQIDGVVGD